MVINNQLDFRFYEVPTVTLTANFFGMSFRIVISFQSTPANFAFESCAVQMRLRHRPLDERVMTNSPRVYKDWLEVVTLPPIAR